LWHYLFGHGDDVIAEGRWTTPMPGNYDDRRGMKLAHEIGLGLSDPPEALMISGVRCICGHAFRLVGIDGDEDVLPKYISYRGIIDARGGLLIGPDAPTDQSSSIVKSRSIPARGAQSLDEASHARRRFTRRKAAAASLLYNSSDFLKQAIWHHLRESHDVSKPSQSFESSLWRALALHDELHTGELTARESVEISELDTTANDS
jgi:hypothetical protein